MKTSRTFAQVFLSLIVLICADSRIWSQTIGPPVKENDKFNQVVLEKLRNDWDVKWKYLPEYSGPDGLQKLTKLAYDLAGDGQGGFDPKRAAGILFEDQAAKAYFLKNYDAVLAIRSIDLDELLASGPIVRVLRKALSLWGIISDYTAKINFARDTLSFIMATLKADNNIPFKDAERKAKDDINLISRLTLPIQQKKEQLYRLLDNKYGFELEELARLGLFPEYQE